MENFLGIDLGTTSVKLALIDQDKKILFERDKAHEALLLPSVKEDDGANVNDGRHEQCPKQILHTVIDLLEEIDTDIFAGLKCIAISGQMHGVVLWEGKSIGFGVDRCNCSPLITWMDSRCDQKFLQKLPKWMESKESTKEKRIATGYGMPTLAWLKQNGALNGEKWDSAGTIMDFLVAILTQSKNVCISTQNAESWGYASQFEWTVQINDSHLFPTHLLPSIVCPGTVIGCTLLPFAKLPKGIPVVVALGDLQASLVPFLSNGVAALHIGTASQIAFISQPPAAETTTNLLALPDSVRCDPFFDGNFLLVAPSLNGGNVFASLFRQIASWSSKLFGFPSDLDKCSSCAASSLLDKVLNSTILPPPVESEASLTVVPTFHGERHFSAREAGAVVKGWRMDTSIEQLILSTARGIVANLAQMMPPAILKANSVHKLKLIGHAKQRVFAEEAKRQFPELQIVLEAENFSAAYGAATHARHIFRKGK